MIHPKWEHFAHDADMGSSWQESAQLASSVSRRAVHFFSKPAKSCRALFKNDSRLTFRSRPRDFLQDILNVAYQITRQIPLASADHDRRSNERA